MTEREIFVAVLQIDDASSRQNYLDDACESDPALRQRVEGLLRALDRSGEFLQRPALGLPAGLTASTVAEGPGQQIGPYKLLEKIGEGGMGAVYMAEQTHPVRRKVALKVIKPGLDTAQVVARFEAERQALALMDHPNIAKVHDAGATEQGRPYFVMELVRGLPVTDYCDQARLPVRERLALFVQVCRAVQHAHQRGVIHRDLKPSNVLVTVIDGRPVPKVIDFGVAKATGTSLTDRTLATGFHQLIGTPLYMSPEQAELSGVDVDTRSDVYALGVLLYELLTGTTPFDAETLRKAPFDDVRRMIREEEPAIPSRRLSTLAAEQHSTVSERRGVDRRRLGRVLRGELDCVVMRALEKDRTCRYETASAFAADVQRYLHDEAVQACPPSAWYRLRKFARQNKRMAVMASFVAALVFVAVTVLGVSYAQIQRALRDKTQALYYQDIAAAARARENKQASRAEEMLEQCPPDLRGWEWHYLKRLPFADFPEMHHPGPGGLTKAAYSPDGRYLASGRLRDGIVRIWDAQTGAEVHKLPGHGRFVRGLAFSPDGRLLAVGSEDEVGDAGMVKLWDLETGQLFRDLPGHNRAVIALAFNRDGSILASACMDDNVRLWETATGRLLHPPLPEKVVARDGLAFRNDGHLLTANMEGTVKMYDVPNGQMVSSFRGNIQWVFPAAFSRDGRLVALGSEDGTVKVWETESGKEIHTLKAHVGEVVCLAFLADDRRLASSGDDRALKLWDLATGQEALQLGVFGSRVQALAVSADGLRLALGTAGRTADRILQVADGRPLERHGPNGQTLVLGAHFDNVVGVVFSPDGRRLASVSWDRTGKVWDAATGEEQHTLLGHEASLTDVAFSPDGRLIATASWDETVRVWEASTGQEIYALRGKAGPVFGVAFSPDGGTLASAHHDGTVKVWQTHSGQQIRSIPVQGHPVLGVAFSPDGHLLACAGGKSDTISVWKVSTEEKPHLLHPDKGIVWAVAFSPNGRVLAAAGSSGAVDLWDVATWEVPCTLLHPLRVYRLSFSPDGRRLTTVSQDQTVRLWDLPTNEKVEIHGHVGDVLCAAFSPDGRRLATGAGYRGKGEIRIREATLWERKP